MPLGLEDYRIPSSALSASSSWNNAHGPDRARINLPNGHGRAGAWVARGRNAHQWLQVELCRPAKITGVATQGRHDAHQWVTTYTVKYSLDGKRFRAYMEYGRNKVCCDSIFLIDYEWSRLLLIPLSATWKKKRETTAAPNLGPE